MSHTVYVYHKSVPNSKNQEKIDLLKHFATGIKANGDYVKNINDLTYSGLEDVSVIQGWITDEPPTKGHQQLRHTVVSRQLGQHKHVVAVDSNLFLYADTKNPLHYLRYSFNGVFPNTGNYCDKDIDPSRWEKISRDLNLSLKDFRTNGNHILFCLQRNGGWSMGNTNVISWISSTIKEIRKYSDRPILIRPHPGDKQAKFYLKDYHIQGRQQNLQISNGTSLTDDLKNCWAAINHNSSPVVGAAIEGIPIFVTDPAKSQCAEIANLDLAKIENPIFHNRLPWVQRLSMFHWKFEELASGECWRHMRNYLTNCS